MWKHCARTCENVVTDCAEKASSPTFCSAASEHKKHATYMRRHCPKTCRKPDYVGVAVELLRSGFSPDPLDWLLYVLLHVAFIAITFWIQTGCNPLLLVTDFNPFDWLYCIAFVAIIIDGFFYPSFITKIICKTWR